MTAPGKETSSSSDSAIVGGGGKKILYALKTLQQIGLGNSAKALTAKNTCKACGLGMGGQAGGMTNELDEFPAVCNKSVQAQSTDIQPPIPAAIFDFHLDEFALLSAREIERLGRLGEPIYKARDSDTFSVVSWEWALEHAADHFAATSPDRSFFYCSGRSSNEAGFVLQLLARVYGTNNVNNCSFYCHQATGVGLDNTIGGGTSTVELADLELSDCIIVIGANPASNHPRFIHQLKACRDRGGQVIVINPAKEPGLVKFALPKSPRSLIAGGSEIASHYVQPAIGGDLALFKGVAKALLARGQVDQAFIDRYTNGYAEFEADIGNTSWHDIVAGSGLQQDQIELLAECYAKAESAVFAWGMGITHHIHGVENVEYISNLALLRGMLGRPGCGLLPLRGHSNVQGIGTIGVKPVLAETVYERMRETLNVDMVDRASPGLDTLACLQAAHEGNMDAALVMGGNLLQASPNTQWAREALSRIPLKVFLTTTLNKGHIDALVDDPALTASEAIILPVAARDEEPEPTTQESMFNFVRMSDGGITRIANARSELDILVQLGNAVQQRRQETVGDTPFDFSLLQSRQSLRKTIARVVPGMEALQDIDVAKREFHISNRLLHEPRFNTRDGKAVFKTAPLPGREGDKAFAFMAMSVRSEGQFNSIVYEENDSYRGVEDRWTILLAPEDIRALSLDDNDMITVDSAHGSMAALKFKAFDLPPGNVMLYYPEANCLIGTHADPRSKTPGFKSIPVNLTKV